jgi:gelsolin
MSNKPENKINWKDSNLSLFGSELEKKIKAVSAEKEHAWDGLGNEVTLRIWRIEKFLVKDWPRRKHGKVSETEGWYSQNDIFLMTVLLLVPQG